MTNKKSITLEVDPTIMEKNMRIIKENAVEEEFNKLLASVDPVPSKIVKPRPGFCVKAFTKPDNKKVFVNICLTDAIPSPRDITNDELMQILNSEDPSTYRVPMSIGEGRTEPDKSGAPATVYDVAINPEFFKKIEKDALFQTFFLTVVFEGLQDKYQFEIEMQKYTVLKNRKSIGTLQSHRIQVRDVKSCEETVKPLIEEIGEKPRPGFCVKAFTKPDNKKVFVNICLTDAIPSPRDITNDELMQILNSEDPSTYRVPMSIGEGRTEPDKSGAPATVYDVAINPEFFKKIEKDALFQTFFLTVVFEGLQDKYQFEIEMQKYTVLKNRKSIGTLQSHRIQVRDVKSCEETVKPLIEEIGEKPIGKVTEVPEVKKEIVYRLRREPPTGQIEYLLAEFKIPSSVELKDLNLEVGEDRLVLDSKGLYDQVDFFLPCSVDHDIIDATLNRNNDMLFVKMPIIH